MRPGPGSDKLQFLEKMTEISRGRPALIGGRSEALGEGGRAMALIGLATACLTPAAPWRGLPRPGALQLHGPRPPGPSSEILSFSLWSRGTNRPADTPSALGRPRHRAAGVQQATAEPTEVVARHPSRWEGPAPWTKAGRERAPKFSNFSKYLRLSRNPEECVPDFEGPAQH